MSECNNCDKYDYKTHSCPIFCDVIRNTLDDVRADERAKVLDEALKSVDFWEMWLHDAICEDRGKLGYNISTAFIEIKNTLKKLKEQNNAE